MDDPTTRPSPDGAAADATDSTGAPAADASSSARPPEPPACLCGGLGPLITQALRSLSVPEEVKRTVHETEREGLRLLRTLIEMRLSSIGPDAPAAEQRGTRVAVD